MAKQKDYFGLSWLVSLILAIIPITSCVLGVATRIKEGHIVAGLLRLLLGWNIIYILDIVFIVLNQRIFRILNI
jgi:uncharacterized membrane protein